MPGWSPDLAFSLTGIHMSVRKKAEAQAFLRLCNHVIQGCA